MDKLQIGEIISGLRKDRKITQDQLANFIGVSSAAVSKWESGSSYPDITLLPKIATFFNISIDRLMNFNIDLSKDEVMKIYDDCEMEYNKPCNLDYAEELCRKYIEKYPNSSLLKFRLGYLNFIYSSKADSEEKCNKMLRYSAELFEEVSNNCEDMEMVEASLFQLGALYSTFEEYDEAISALNKIRRSTCDPDDILSVIYIYHDRLKEGRSLLQQKLLKCINAVGLACTALANSYRKHEKDFEMEERYHTLSIEIKKLLSPEADGILGLSMEYYQLAESCLYAGKYDRAIEILNTMCTYLSNNDMNSGIDINNIWCFNELKMNDKRLKLNMYENLYKLFEQPIYDPIRETNEFRKIISQLKKIEKKFAVNKEQA